MNHGEEVGRVPDFFIREAGEGDAAGILECLQLAFAPYRPAYTPEAFSDTVLSLETIGLRMAAMTLLVAVRQGGGIAGCIGYKMTDREEGHIRGMAVHPDCLGQGVAQALLDRAEAALRGRACRRVRLNTTAPLRRAIRFYERNGYQPSGMDRDFFGMQLYGYVKDLGSADKGPLLDED